MNPPPRPEGLLTGAVDGLVDGLGYPFFQAVWDRKSRRVGLGMEIANGPLSYRSPYEPVPLSELEEALLLAATGLTGLNLADIDPTQGADALVQWTTRTWPSSCSNHGTELFFTNNDGTYFLDMWKLMPEPGEISTLSGKPIEAQVEWIEDLTRRAKVQMQDSRAQLPTGLPGLFVFNHWNANQPGTTLFLRVEHDVGVHQPAVQYLSPEYRFSIIDEQNGYRSAGLDRWIASGRVDEARRMGMIDLKPQRVLSMQVVEQAFICHNAGTSPCNASGWAVGRSLGTSRFVLGGVDVPGLGFRFADAARGPSVPVGCDGVFEAFTPRTTRTCATPSMRSSR